MRFPVRRPDDINKNPIAITSLLRGNNTVLGKRFKRGLNNYNWTCLVKADLFKYEEEL